MDKFLPRTENDFKSFNNTVRFYLINTKYHARSDNQENCQYTDYKRYRI